MQNLCRTCMGTECTMVNIFSDIRDPALEHPEENLSYILSECTNRTVRRDDCQPQFICLTCVQAAQMAFRFKRQCDRSYHLFCELQNNEGHTKQEDCRSDASPARHGGTNNIEMKLCQTLDGTKRTTNIPNVVGTRFQCYHCPNTYQITSGLGKHLVNHCSKAFWLRDTYIGHLLTHDIRSPVTCNQFPNATHMEIRMREHNGGGIEKTLSVPNDLNLEANNIDMTKKENSLNAIEEKLPLLKTVHNNLCDLCSDSFMLEDDLRIHRILEHNISVTESAENSETSGLDWEQLRMDLSLESSTIEDLSIETSEDIPTSRQAESGFNQESIFGQHMQSHYKFLKKPNKFCNSEAKGFQFPICKGCYKSEKCMQKHNDAHFSKPKHHCPICSKPFWQRFNLTRHQRTHDKEGPYPCRQCSAIFIDRKQFNIHQCEHEEQNVGEKFPVAEDPDNNIDKINDFRILQMLNCNVNDTNPAAGSSTMLRDWEPDDLNLSEESSDIDDFCIQRSEDNPTARQMESVFDQDYGEKRKKLPSAEEKCVEFPVCQSTYKNTKGMLKHLNTHTSQPKYTCSICSKTFLENSELSRHLRTHVDNGKGVWYSCDLCSGKFTYKYTLHRHKREVHEKLGVVKCMHCSKEYKSKRALKIHEIKTHVC